jgi:Na+/melibiose symporter-like transporter
MSVNFVQEKKRQKYLIIFFVIIVLITVIVLWFGYFKKEKPVSPPVSASPYYAEIKIDFAALENDFLKELQPFEKAPPFEGAKGRNNPFLPY